MKTSLWSYHVFVGTLVGHYYLAEMTIAIKQELKLRISVSISNFPIYSFNLQIAES